MIQCLRELVDWCMFAWFYHHTLNTVVSLDQQSLSLTTSSCLLFEVGNDNRDTTFDDGVSLPASYISIHFGQNSTCLTSASFFQWFLVSIGDALQASPMILEISGLARPGFCATTAA